MSTTDEAPEPQAETTTRTGPLVVQLIDGLREDIREAAEHLRRGRLLIGALEGETKGVNGLSAFLRAKGGALDTMIDDLSKEADQVEKKMTGAGSREITQSVDAEKAAEVRAARGAS